MSMFAIILGVDPIGASGSFCGSIPTMPSTVYMLVFKRPEGAFRAGAKLRARRCSRGGAC